MSRIEYRPASPNDIALFNKFLDERDFDNMAKLFRETEEYVLWGRVLRSLSDKDREWVELVRKSLKN